MLGRPSSNVAMTPVKLVPSVVVTVVPVAVIVIGPGQEDGGRPAVARNRSWFRAPPATLMVRYGNSPSGNVTSNKTLPAASTSVNRVLGLKPHVITLSLPPSNR